MIACFCRPLLCLPAVVLALAVLPGRAETPAPDAGEAARAIKGLSQDEIAGLLDGRGMGLAKAAELNHYPGPAHVLELADELGLTPEQKAKTETLHGDMQAEARQTGRAIVEKEATLEALFADGRAQPEQVGLIIAEIAALRGTLRYQHLTAHIEMRRILTDAQVALYDRLRGYAADDGEGGHTHQHGTE